MLEALEQVTGADWDRDCADAWRAALGRLTDVMRAAGRRAGAATG